MAPQRILTVFLNTLVIVQTNLQKVFEFWSGANLVRVHVVTVNPKQFEISSLLKMWDFQFATNEHRMLLSVIDNLLGLQRTMEFESAVASRTTEQSYS